MCPIQGRAQIGVFSKNSKLRDGAVGRGFGASVAISGDTLAVGSPAYGNSAAYVFTRSGTTWSLQQEMNWGQASIPLVLAWPSRATRC